ncbi:MAG: 4Fe-4S cluster-binding domain-containing protein [Bryobacteraceae bacterium]
MLIHGFVAHSLVNGPGVRAVVYLQGCNLGCASCWNPATHAFVGPPRGVLLESLIGTGCQFMLLRCAISAVSPQYLNSMRVSEHPRP